MFGRICGLLGHKMSSTTSYNTSSSSVHISNSRQGVINLTLKIRLVHHSNLPRSPLQHPGSNSVHTPGAACAWCTPCTVGNTLSCHTEIVIQPTRVYSITTVHTETASLSLGGFIFPYFFHIYTHLLSAHFTVQPYNHINKWLVLTKNKYTRFISCRDHTKT